MAEPTSALSFERLIIKIAREAGMAYYGSGGNERAMVPIDPHDLDLCREVVNDGIRMFINAAPKTGWRWMRRIMSVTLTATRITGTADAADSTSLTDATLETDYDSDDDLNGYWIYILTGTGAGSYAQITDYTASGGVVTVADWLDAYGNAGGTDPDAASTFAITPVETVGGNISRYPLAENFGGSPDGPIHYSSETNHSTHIEWCDESTIRAKRSVTVQTGYPQLAAIRPLEPLAGGFGPKRRYELVLDPQPVAADTLEFPYTLYFDELQLEAGTATANTGSTSVVDSTLANLYPDDYFNGWVVKIISGTGKNSYAVVSDYTGSTGTFTVADWLNIDGSAGGTDPVSGSIYVVQPSANLHPAGFMFDEVIESACKAKAEIEIEDVNSGYVQKYTQMDLPMAYSKDARLAPRKLVSRDRIVRERIWGNVTTDHDV